MLELCYGSGGGFMIGRLTVSEVRLTLDGWRCLEKLAKYGGRMNTLNPKYVPHLLNTGVAKRDGDWVVITDLGRSVV